MAKGTKVPTQPDGMPQGRHISGFKGMTVKDQGCMCGNCHPNAQAGKGKIKWIVPKGG